MATNATAKRAGAKLRKAESELNIMEDHLKHALSDNERAIYARKVMALKKERSTRVRELLTDGG
jgi:hypothetical protein